MGNFLNLVYDDVDVTRESIINYFDSYVGMENYKVFDINEIPEDGNKYYYFFQYRYYLVTYFVSEKKLPLSEKVINLLKNEPRFNIILINDAESDDDVLIEYLDNIFGSIGIDTNKIVVINCNENNYDLKKKLNSNIITHSTNNGKLAYANEMMRFPYEFEESRNFLFMCYNRHIKEHRFALLIRLMKNNILDNVDWSWIRGYQVSENNLINDENLNESVILQKLFTFQEIENFREEILKLKNIKVKKSVYEIDGITHVQI